MPSNKVEVGLKFLIEEAKKSPVGVASKTPTGYLIPVDYSLSTEELIKLGNFDSVGRGLEFFPRRTWGEATVEIELFKLRRTQIEATWNRALLQIGEKGYRGADLAELATLAGFFPLLQRRNSIIGLGSILQSGGVREVPLVGAHSDGSRWLDRGRMDDNYYNLSMLGTYRFAVVKIQ